MIGFVFGFAGGDGVSGSDFSPPSQLWFQTKWVVVGLDLLAWVWWLGLGLPAWVWGLWAIVADQLVEVVVDRLPWVWLGCEKIYIKKELFYNILI